MVLAPLFLLVGAIVHPGFKTDEAELLASAAGRLDAWYLAEMLFLISIVLAVPAALAGRLMVRRAMMTTLGWCSMTSARNARGRLQLRQAVRPAR